MRPLNTLEMPGVTEGVQESIDRTLREQAQENELTIAKVRLLVVTVTLAIEALTHFWSLIPNRTPLGLVAFSSLWWVLAAALLVALRRGLYGFWVPFLVPAQGAFLLVVNHVYAWRVLVSDSEGAQAINVSYAITCSLVIGSGALRMTRAAAAWSAVVGLAAFAAGLLLVVTTATWVFPIALLLGMGAYSWWMTDVVRRAVESEIGKITLRRFLPSSVVEGAHTDPLALVTSPRSVEATILVSDLRGFTALSESIAPAEVLALLNEIQGAFARVVQENGGTIDKFMGDGMLAVFGAVVPLPSHAAAAVASARGLRRALAVVNAARAARAQAPLAMGMGIHSGDVIVGCLGGAERLEFTVLGDTVNVASRLESLTKEKKVDALVSDETARRLAAGGLEPLCEVAVRGRAEPLRVFGVPPT